MASRVWARDCITGRSTVRFQYLHSMIIRKYIAFENLTSTAMSISYSPGWRFPLNFRLFDILARLQKSNWRTIVVTYCSYSELVISVVLRRCDLYQKLPRPYDFPVTDQNRFNNPRRRRAHRVLHFHRLEDDQRIARRDLLPRLDQNLQHLPRHG